MGPIPGSRLGAYDILSVLGEGGMGAVYLARDTKLGRDVAIKCLLRHFTTDSERLVRFEREARVLASVNHPHIGAIYGLEDAGGVPALVLELVDGATLADRIARRPLPVNDTLAIARQIADALDVAHEKGIVHRDLKPANIKITPNGVVKVLDFGLAKAVSGDAATADLTQSTTVTVGGTGEGVILGTAVFAPDGDTIYYTRMAGSLRGYQTGDARSSSIGTMRLVTLSCSIISGRRILDSNRTCYRQERPSHDHGNARLRLSVRDVRQLCGFGADRSAGTADGTSHPPNRPHHDQGG